MKITSGGQMESVDTFDFRDMEDRPFHEPSVEVCPELLSDLQQGQFSVLVTIPASRERLAGISSPTGPPRIRSRCSAFEQ